MQLSYILYLHKFTIMKAECIDFKQEICNTTMQYTS